MIFASFTCNECSVKVDMDHNAVADLQNGDRLCSMV
jgi:hypothetical protein